MSGVKFRYVYTSYLVYGPIYGSIVLLTSTIAFVLTNVKKFNERFGNEANLDDGELLLPAQNVDRDASSSD